MRFLNEALLRAVTGWQELRIRLSDEEGQTLAEYGLLIAVVAVIVVAGAVTFFQGQLSGAFNAAGDCLTGTCVVP
jgi:Flp pilus assembly pilin Flp